MSTPDFLKQTRLFVLDMDGTVYLGETRLPGAAEFVAHVRGLRQNASGTDQIPLLFFTNNSSRSRDDYVAKLARLGIIVAAESIMTSADVMIDYLHQHYRGQAVCLLGTPACAEAFRSAGIVLDDRADVCVAAFDTTLTYEKLVVFCDRLRAGAVFLATHPDLNCPVEGGFIPDLGAMLALIEASTWRRPDAIAGKPYKPTVDAITRRTGVAPEHITFVGDRLYTDIAVAKAHGASAVLVLSGETDEAMLAASDIKPDAVVLNLADLLSRMEHPA